MLIRGAIRVLSPSLTPVAAPLPTLTLMRTLNSRPCP